MKRRIFIDMDGTIAQYNRVRLEEVCKPGYFVNLPAMQNMIKAIIKLQLSGYFDIYILSAVFNDDHSQNEKNIWLDKYLPIIPRQNRIFTPVGDKKRDYIPKPSADDILIDDYTENLLEWDAIGIKCMNGQNGSKGRWLGYIVSAKSKPEIIASTIIGIHLALSA